MSSEATAAERTIEDLIPRQLTFTPKEVGRLLGLGEATVYQALRTGVIPSMRFGKPYKVTRATLIRLLGGTGGGS